MTEHVLPNDEPQAHAIDEYTSGKKLIHTCDAIQKRFWCGETELTVWRNILLYRYSAIKESDIKLQVTDYDPNDEILSLPALQWITDVPNELAKTTIRLFFKSTKRITVTLYFKTAVNSGTLLCQGKDCSCWDLEECEKLKHPVSVFLQDKDVNSLTASLLHVPLSFIKPAGPLSLTTPMMHPHAEQTASHQEDPDTGTDTGKGIPSPAPRAPPPSSASEAHLILSCDFTHGKVVLHPPTPSPAEALVSSSGTKPTTLQATPLGTKPSLATPSGTKRKKLRRRTLCVNQSHNKESRFSLHSYKLQFSELKEAVEDLTFSQQNIKDTFLSLIEDTKTATKNEMKCVVKSKVDTVCSRIIDLETKVTVLKEAMDALAKDNQSLRSQLGNLRAEAKARRSRRSEVDASTQMNEEETVLESRLNAAGGTPSSKYAQPDSRAIEQQNPEVESASPAVTGDSTQPDMHSAEHGSGGNPLVSQVSPTPTVQSLATEEHPDDSAVKARPLDPEQSAPPEASVEDLPSEHFQPIIPFL